MGSNPFSPVLSPHTLMERRLGYEPGNERSNRSEDILCSRSSMESEQWVSTPSVKGSSPFGCTHMGSWCNGNIAVSKAEDKGSIPLLPVLCRGGSMVQQWIANPPCRSKCAIGVQVPATTFL